LGPSSRGRSGHRSRRGRRPPCVSGTRGRPWPTAPSTGSHSRRRRPALLRRGLDGKASASPARVRRALKERVTYAASQRISPRSCGRYGGSGGPLGGGSPATDRDSDRSPSSRRRTTRGQAGWPKAISPFSTTFSRSTSNEHGAPEPFPTSSRQSSIASRMLSSAPSTVSPRLVAAWDGGACHDVAAGLIRLQQHLEVVGLHSYVRR
jgi:hypothetical protein